MERLRWSRGERAGLWYPISRVQTRPKLSVHFLNLRHVKEPKSDMEVVTFGKILGNFSPIVPSSVARVRSRRFRHEGHLVAGV